MSLKKKKTGQPDSMYEKKKKKTAPLGRGISLFGSQLSV